VPLSFLIKLKSKNLFMILYYNVTQKFNIIRWIFTA
jgi:hypothetical protein